MKHRITSYTVKSAKIAAPLRFAVISDLHGGAFEDVLPQCAECDAILVPGDLVNRHRFEMENVRAFLRQAPKTAPTFLSVGNHERKCPDPAATLAELKNSGATLLDNEVVPFKGIYLGGLSSNRKNPDCRVLDELEACDGFRLLLCHHPEYFPRFIAERAIDLTLSGHAHGGQVVICGRGLYAPGQGLLPRLTHGLYFDDRLLVSRGMTNSANAPRWNDPCEMLLLTLEPQ